jgi:hypothetical protein
MNKDGMLSENALVPRRPSRVELLEKTSATFVSWSDISGTKPKLQDIVDRLRNYGLSMLLGELARIMMTLERREVPADSTRANRDMRILAGLVGQEIGEEIQSRVAAREAVEHEPVTNRVFFHPRQILTAMKLGLLYVDDLAAHGPSDRRGLLDALLMVNDILDERIEHDDFSTTEGKQRAAVWEFAQAIFNTANRDPQSHARALHWFLEPQQSDASRTRFDIRMGLKRATGLAPLDVYTALMALNADPLTRTHGDLVEGRVLHNPRTYLTGLRGMDEAMRESWYRLSTATIDDLQSRVRKRYATEIQHFDFFEFELTPLVETGGGVLCLSSTFLNHLGTSGLYHRMLSRDVFSASERQAFQGELGPVVERYVVDGIKRMSGSRCIDEAAMLAFVREGQKVPDAVVVFGSTAIVFEVKAARTMLSARHGEGFEALVATWRKAIERAAGQIAAFAALVRANTLSAIGLGADDIKRIYPVVVTYDHIALPHTYEQVCAPLIATTALGDELASGFVKRPCYMTVKDVEILESLVENGHGLVNILYNLISVPGPAVPPLWQYIASTKGLDVQTFSKWHRSEYERLHAMVKARLMELGLGPDDTPASEGTTIAGK